MTGRPALRACRTVDPRDDHGPPRCRAVPAPGGPSGTPGVARRHAGTPIGHGAMLHAREADVRDRVLRPHPRPLRATTRWTTSRYGNPRTSGRGRGARGPVDDGEPRT